MSRETSEWLNTMTLIGFTAERGNAWHYRKESQGSEPNHYEQEIPVEDVLRRLFNWEAVEAEVLFRLPDGRIVESQQARKGILRSDTDFDMGVFKEGYSGHSYQEWLLENVATILDDDLKIGSAGLLRQGGQAWVSVEMPENIETPEGVSFRPHLLASTSFDGSLATSYGRKVTLVVCDNTRDIAMAEKGQSLKIRHSKYSNLKITDARKALEIVHTMADDFAAEVAALTAQKVEPAHWVRVLDTIVPLPEDDGRAKTVALKKRSELISLYTNDQRVAPWKDTAFGVAQAFNTWMQHNAQVRKGTPRVIRNMENVVKGKYAQADANVLQVLAATA